MFKKKFFLVLMIILVFIGSVESNTEKPVRIGFFRGGRVNMIYRASIFGFFDNEGIDVELYTTEIRGKELILLLMVTQIQVVLLILTISLRDLPEYSMR